jgi:hypothetical protein
MKNILNKIKLSWESLVEKVNSLIKPKKKSTIKKKRNLKKKVK